MNGFSFFIGLRYTLSRKQSHLVAFISRVSTLGMVLAVSILITVLSVMNGFDRELRERILAIVPHATLTGFDATTDWRRYVDMALEQDGVVDAMPFSYLQGLVTHGAAVKPVFFYGIDPVFEKENSILSKLMGQDLLHTLTADKKIILGKKLADKLKVNVNDIIQVIVPSVDHTELPVMDYFTAIGFLDSGTELDEKIILTHRSNIAQLNNKPIDSVDGIRIVVDDLFAARIIASGVSQATHLYQVRDWSSTHGNLYQAVQMSRKMVLLLVFIIIAVAAFNVVSTLVLAVNDKARDIAILRTMGASHKQVLSIFIVQGAVIGLIGVVIGVFCGVLFSYFVSDGIKWLEHVLHYQFLKTDVYPVDHLPSDIRLKDISIVAIVAFLLSVFATIIPAWQAGKVDPAKVLRYE
jgi:lipoprotein-releasing system permease protein